MEYKFYLILEKRLFCEVNNHIYEYVDNKWVNGDWKEVHDRLIGYDPYEPSDSPYKIGNTDIMGEIKNITLEEVIKEYGQEVIDKLNN